MLLGGEQLGSWRGRDEPSADAVDDHEGDADGYDVDGCDDEVHRERVDGAERSNAGKCEDLHQIRGSGVPLTIWLRIDLRMPGQWLVERS